MPVRWIAAKDVASLLGVSVVEIRRKVLRKVLQARRVGGTKGRLYFEEAEIARYQQMHPLVGRKGQ